MATRPQTRQLPRDQIPPPPSRLPEYVPLPPPTSLGPDGEVEEQQELAQAPPNWPYPPPMTIADEQRARSLDIQAMGVTAYMAQFDTRTAEEMNQPVAGVGATAVSESELRRR